jgi:pilus assembly protein CpaF
VGAGPLGPLLLQPSVTDILVNGPRDVWVDRGDGLERVDVSLGRAESVRRLAQRLAATAGRRLDEAAPWCDVLLPDGVRLHAVLPPICGPCTVLSLRIPARRAWTLESLQRAGALGPVGADLLGAIVGSRVSFLVSGGTGTGKTTLLATLLGLLPKDERLVIVEDLPELVPDHAHTVRLSGRPPNVEGAGEVTLHDLVRQALRMRPDRLVVGECRGAEVVDLLAALNTGHDGGCGTVHANSAQDVPARLEALAVSAGLTRGAVHSQMASALAVIIHLARAPDGTRVLEAVGLVDRDPEGWVAVESAAVRRGDDLVPGPAHAGLARILESAPGG